MIRKVLGLSFMIGVASMFAFACGDDDAAAGDKYPNVDSFCDAKATLECASPSVGTCAVPVATCKTKRKDACLAAAAAAAGRAYGPKNAEACLNLVKDAYANANDKAKLTTYQDTCEKVFSGSKTKGTACSGKYECTADLFCDLEKTKPLCATKLGAHALNEGCANSGDTCQDGLYCTKPNNGDPPLCAAKITANGACGETVPCVDSTFCDGRTCRPLGEVGTPCTQNKECASSFCNPTAQKCGARQFPTEKGDCSDVGG